MKKLSCPDGFYSTLAQQRLVFREQAIRRYRVQPAVLQWFISHIETFAPAGQRQERQQFYATLLALQPAPSTTLYDDVGVFVLAQIMAAHQLATPMAAGKRPERSSAHTTWYAKERQRVAKLLQQIAESPVVASFQSAVTYYEAADVTCQHGRNQKTCEALYVLRLTLQLLEQQQTSRWVRKQVERLRQREPSLPQLNELCAPLGRVTPCADTVAPVVADEIAAPVSGVSPETAATAAHAPDDLTAYLLGTMVGRLRHVGLTVAQSCALVDRALHCCFGRPDPLGTRPAILAEQWRRLNRQMA
jgi:hypothetical protein